MNTPTSLKARLREKITGTNIAVLSTSDIYTIYRDRGDANLKDTHTDETSGKVTRFWTQGILEKALEMGFIVWVVSTRSGPQPHDDWWRKLVPGSQTIFHSPDLAKKWKTRLLAHFDKRLTRQELLILEENLNRDEASPGCFSSLPHMVWALLMDLEWPTIGDYSDEAVLTDGPEFWTSAQLRFANEGKIVLSPYFAHIVRAEEPCKLRNGTCIVHGNAAGECDD